MMRVVRVFQMHSEMNQYSSIAFGFYALEMSQIFVYFQVFQCSMPSLFEPLNKFCCKTQALFIVQTVRKRGKTFVSIACSSTMKKSSKLI